MRDQTIVSPTNFIFHIKGYGYEGHPLDVCMREEDKRENTMGGDGLVMKSLSSAFDSPYHNALMGVCVLLYSVKC